MMANRLLELHRVLKPTGSLYLHCDPTASHYLKIVVDGVFGPKNFRNEVVWKRTFAHGSASRWGDIHDTVLFYTKSDQYTWNRIDQALDEDYVDSKYRFQDARGRYRLVVLTGPGTTKGASGQPWRGYDPTDAGRYWAISKRAIETLRAEGVAIPTDLHEQLELLYQHGYIRFPQKKTGRSVPEFKLYLPSGQPIQDMILDIAPINSQALDRLGYPTQKPLALLERIISASSNEGDVVLDPFCGCGTAVHAAQKLKRRWIGIDITHLAISLIEQRLKDFPDIRFQVHGTPKNMEGAQALAARDKHQFQWWACSLLNAQPYKAQKKGADGGVDGLIFFQDDQDMAKKIVVSVKGGEHVNAAMIRDLKGVIERERATIGVFLTLARPSRPMRTEAAAAGFYCSPTFEGPYPRLQILTVEGVLNGTERVRYPDMSDGRLTFKKAPREAHPSIQQTLLLGS